MNHSLLTRWLWCFGFVFAAAAIVLMCLRAGKALRLDEQLAALKRGDIRSAIVRKLGEPVAETETAAELAPVLRTYVGDAPVPVRGKALVYRTSGADLLYVLDLGSNGRLAARFIVSRTRSGAEVGGIGW